VEDALTVEQKFEKKVIPLRASVCLSVVRLLHQLMLRFSNCGTGTPWGTRDALQGYHKPSFVYIFTVLIKHEL
jgi:hypothetical protein